MATRWPLVAVEQLQRSGRSFLKRPVGEESVMQDAERAAQEALEQKATQQTLGGEGGELDAATVDEVLPANRHLPLVYRDEPPVGEGGPTVLPVEILDEPCRSPAVEDLREHMHGQEEVAADGHPAGGSAGAHLAADDQMGEEIV